MLRLVQEDLERARQWRLEKQQVQQPVQQPPPPPPPQPTMTNGNNNNTATVPDQERMRKIEAFQRKQRELEATQAAEERIIREAQRRKEEEIHRQVQVQPQQWRPAPGNIPAPPPATSSTNQRLDNLIHQPSTEVAATTKRVSFFQETTTSTSREDTDVITFLF